MKYIVLQQHTNDTGLHKQHELVEYSIGQAEPLLQAGIIAKQIESVLKPISKKKKNAN